MPFARPNFFFTAEKNISPMKNKNSPEKNTFYKSQISTRIAAHCNSCTDLTLHKINFLPPKFYFSSGIFFSRWKKKNGQADGMGISLLHCNETVKSKRKLSKLSHSLKLSMSLTHWTKKWVILDVIGFDIYFSVIAGSIWVNGKIILTGWYTSFLIVLVPWLDLLLLL